MPAMGQPVAYPEATPVPPSRRNQNFAAAMAALQQARNELEAIRATPISLAHAMVNQQCFAGQQFWLVVLSDDGLLHLEHYATVEKLIAAIRDYTDRDVAVVPFLGYHMPVTKGPYRYLRTPSRQLLPIFSIPDPDAVEDEDYGWLGKEGAEVPEPMAAEAPPAAQPAEAGGSPAEDPDDTPLWDEQPPGTAN